MSEQFNCCDLCGCNLTAHGPIHVTLRFNGSKDICLSCWKELQKIFEFILGD